jgi:hypothetical protein
MLITLALALPGTRALAQEGKPLLKSLTIQEVAKVAKEEGFHVMKVFPEDDMLFVKVEGYSVLLRVADKGQVLGGDFRLLGGPKVTLERINRWNQSKWFTRAYLDKTARPVLVFEMDLRYGATRESVAGHLVFFLHGVPRFVKHVSD